MLKLCKTCRKEVSSKAKNCPNCGEKNPTSPFPKFFEEFLAVIVIFIMAQLRLSSHTFSQQCDKIVIMKKPKINFFRFLLVELKCFLFDWEVIVFICAIISSFILLTKGNCLSELEKVLYGGIVSGFVFYFLIEFLPRTANKRKNLIRLAIEMKKCFEYINSVFLDIKAEFPNEKIDIKEEQRFFKVLKSQNRKYNPISKNLRLVKCTTNTNPINFIYCNLGEALEIKYLGLKEKIIHLDKVASTIQLESIDFDSLMEINQMADRKAVYKDILIILPHTNNDSDNNAAVFGTDFDIICDKLSIVRNRLQERFTLNIN